MAVNEWAGVVNTTAPRYLKGASDQTIRNRQFLALGKKHGMFTYNEDGYDLNVTLEAIEATPSGYSDGAVLDYARINNFRRLNFDWRGYFVTDLMTEKETLMNRGDQQLIDRYATIMPRLTKNLTNNFGTQVWTDGYASGNENLLCGIDSFTGTGTVAAGDRIAEPSDTYGGKSTAVGNLGGSWDDTLTTQPNSTISTDWPDGEGSSEYDWISAKLMNYSSTGWGTGATTWEDNCERVLRQATIWTTLLGGLEGKPDCYMLSGNLFYGYLNKQSAKQRIITPYKDLEDLGFNGSIQQEGVGITTEFGIAANTGYGINFDQVQMRCMYSQLFMPKGPDWDPKTLSWLFAVGFFGNMTWNCKFFSKIRPYA